ncbi:MAG: Zn-ribbon domain-containing OB-fold protein, partial [archaeon]|nr:Zn-ribbon domain-containing OB-fold protein [archaeon]
FYENLAKGELSAPKCKSCQSYVMPPTSACSKCLSTNLEWVKLRQRGKIISFSEIFVSNKKFQDRTPYVVSIIETEDGVRLPGIFKNTTSAQVKIGEMVSLTIDPKDFSEGPDYFFTLVK